MNSGKDVLARLQLKYIKKLKVMVKDCSYISCQLKIRYIHEAEGSNSFFFCSPFFLTGLGLGVDILRMVDYCLKFSYVN